MNWFILVMAGLFEARKDEAEREGKKHKHERGGSMDRDGR
jgi:hypothetical protein